MKKSNSNISTLNVSSIVFTLKLLGRKTPRIILSSKLPIRSHERTDRLIEICNLVGIKNVLNGWGGSSEDSVHTHQKLESTRIKMYKMKKNTHNGNNIYNEGVSAIHWIFMKGSEFVNTAIDDFENAIERVV